MSGAETRRTDGAATPHPLADQRRADAFERADQAPSTSEPVLTGHWVQRSRRRYLRAAVLGLTLVGVAVGLELTFTVRTFEALAVLVGFTIMAVIAHTALSVATPTDVTLDGPRVVVRRGGHVDEFDLTGPLMRVVTTGRPNRPNWRIRFETGDGLMVELGPAQVDPHVMTEVLARYRSKPVPQQRRTT